MYVSKNVGEKIVRFFFFYSFTSSYTHTHTYTVANTIRKTFRQIRFKHSSIIVEARNSKQFRAFSKANEKKNEPPSKENAIDRERGEKKKRVYTQRWNVALAQWIHRLNRQNMKKKYEESDTEEHNAYLKIMISIHSEKSNSIPTMRQFKNHKTTTATKTNVNLIKLYSFVFIISF